ncbi:putative uridine nucleosidase 2-like, partial [Trifolium medium]|nr:putative uridine nucleosidase 2-like [Trifolium medium]
SGADVLAVGINVTHQVVLSGSDREKLASSKGKFAQYLTGILEVYFSYHFDAYNTNGVYLHDPTALLAAVDPSLVTCTEGAVRVQTSGITRGLTLLCNKQKRYKVLDASNIFGWWFRHLWRRSVDCIVRRVDQMKNSPVSRVRGTPRKTVGEAIKKIFAVNGLARDMIYDRKL